MCESNEKPAPDAKPKRQCPDAAIRDALRNIPVPVEGLFRMLRVGPFSKDRFPSPPFKQNDEK